MRIRSHVERAKTLLVRSVLSHSFLLLSYFDERLTAREQIHWEVVIRTQAFQNEVTRNFQYDLPAGAMIHPLA